jgi:hypothetical protein
MNDEFDDDSERTLQEYFGIIGSGMDFDFEPPVAEQLPTEPFRPDIPSSSTSYDEKMEALAEKLKFTKDVMAKLRSRIWQDGNDGLSVDELAGIYGNFAQKDCDHRTWIETKGLFKSWFNCSKCGIGKEKV